MSATRKRLISFLEASPQVALVEIIQAKGSTPREVATWMLVSPQSSFGTIGGGQLEFMAIARAREMIGANIDTDKLDVALGPEIGQCCGGRVKIYLALCDEELREAVLGRIVSEETLHPSIYLFGGGHVGHALAAQIALLPLKTTVIETRPEAVQGMSEGVATIVTAVPEEVVRQAPPRSSFVILTHDHALDFLIVSEALRRGDADYVGMIGSKTKRATFNSWYLREAGGAEADLQNLVCPIGGTDVKDKRPEIIAALVVSEIIRAIAASDRAVAGTD